LFLELRIVKELWELFSDLRISKDLRRSYEGKHLGGSLRDSG